MLAILFLILLICVCGAGAGLLTALAVWLRIIFSLLDALVQQVPRGVLLLLRLATWFAVRLLKVSRWSYLHAKRGGLWAAQHAYVWVFVWSYRLREWYVESELKKRRSA